MIYFDFESLIGPVESYQNNVTCRPTEVIEVHQPFRFCLVVIELDNTKPAFMKVERSEKPMEIFADVLEKLAKDIYQNRQHHTDFRSSDPLGDSLMC